MPIEAQIALHNGSLDVPLKIFTMRIKLKCSARNHGEKSSADFSTRSFGGKTKLAREPPLGESHFFVRAVLRERPPLNEPSAFVVLRLVPPPSREDGGRVRMRAASGFSRAGGDWSQRGRSAGRHGGLSGPQKGKTQRIKQQPQNDKTHAMRTAIVRRAKGWNRGVDNLHQL